MAALGDEDVGRFDVAMNDASGVGRIQGIRDLDAHCEYDSRSRGWPVKLSGRLAEF